MNTDMRSKPFNPRPPEAPHYSIRPPICFGQAHRSSDGIDTSDPMMKSDKKCQTEGLMTRRLLLTAAILALVLAPSIGTGTAQARGFYGGGYGRGFHGGYGRGFLRRIRARIVRRVRRFLSGLLRVWLFPVLLLLLLIAYGLCAETAQPRQAWTGQH